MLVIVTGLPASGKTTLARTLAARLGLPLFSLDAIKEALYDAAGTRRPSGPELRFCAEAVLTVLVADAPRGAVIDIWLDPARADRARLATALPSGAATHEVLCDVPADLAVRRYAARHRHGVHRGVDSDIERQIHTAADLIAARPRGTSHGLGDVIRVDTTEQVDVDALIRALTR
jgi:glucokinase